MLQSANDHSGMRIEFFSKINNVLFCNIAFLYNLLFLFLGECMADGKLMGLLFF